MNKCKTFVERKRLMHFESSRIAVLLPLWFSSSNGLNDWNGAQRWNPSIDSGQAFGTTGTGRGIKRQRYFVGRRIVRHMCEVGLLSKPKPSSGCLKLRPTMSMKGSQLTTALGSKE
jgi:hypothetical protein